MDIICGVAGWKWAGFLGISLLLLFCICLRNDSSNINGVVLITMSYSCNLKEMVKIVGGVGKG